MFERFEVLRDAEMSRFTTLKLGGPADYLAFPRSAEEITALFEEAGKAGMPVTVIGHGSNLLVLDGGIRGLVIRVEKNMRTIRREGNRIIAQAGAMLGTPRRRKPGLRAWSSPAEFPEPSGAVFR